MQAKTSEEARRDFRRILNDAEHGKPTMITRYGLAVATVVPIEWYTLAETILGREASDD